jgi:Lar family restriction alleviation protein
MKQVTQSVPETSAPVDSLLPCPFCGSPAELYEAQEYLRRDAEIRCSECCARTRTVDTAEQARALWNRRPVERLRRGVRDVCASCGKRNWIDAIDRLGVPYVGCANCTVSGTSSHEEGS